MRHIKYGMSLQGQSNLLNPSLRLESDAGVDRSHGPDADAKKSGNVGRSLVRAAADHDRIEFVEGIDQLTYALQSSGANKAVFTAEIAAEDETFRETGKVRFGDGQHELWLSSAVAGLLLPDAHPGRKQGAATLRVDGGIGVFKGATGLVTTNFVVHDDGTYHDVHTAVISLSDELGSASVQEEERVRVRDVIDEKAFPVTADATMEFVADLLVLTKTSALMVVDVEGNFVGVVSEVDLLHAVMPDVDAILDVGGTLNDALSVFLANGRTMADRPISRLVKRHPRTVAPDDELLAVATVMLKTDVRRLPVVDRGKFVGSISLADVCWALLSKWNGLVQK